jgi:hypothetical protein
MVLIFHINVYFDLFAFWAHFDHIYVKSAYFGNILYVIHIRVKQSTNIKIKFILL